MLQSWDESARKYSVYLIKKTINMFVIEYSFERISFT